MLKPASSKCPSSQVTCDKNTSATPLCCRLPHIAVEETVRQRAQNARGRPKVNRGTWSKSLSYFKSGCFVSPDVTVSVFRILSKQPSELEDAWFKEVEEREEVQLWEEQKPGAKTAGEDFQVQCGCQSRLPSNEGKYFIYLHMFCRVT